VDHPVVSHEEWLRARVELLDREKAFTYERERMAQAVRDLPWERVEKEYVFEGARGEQSLLDLFEGRLQLVVYHFMFPPEWDAGCPNCSFWADNFDPIVVHLHHRDTSMVAISRAPYPKLAAYRERMGWSFQWLSSFESDFNYDFGVSFTPEQQDVPGSYNYNRKAEFSDREGMSAFIRDGDDIFHTYSSYGRGIDIFNTAYNYLDVTALGRHEGDRGQSWVRRHDEYGQS
jgi:predicted dithiol-disulfide oxidoreductase (DUF899 family)